MLTEQGSGTFVSFFRDLALIPSFSEFYSMFFFIFDQFSRGSLSDVNIEKS